jgi:hypothetical protein
MDDTIIFGLIDSFHPLPVMKMTTGVEANNAIHLSRRHVNAACHEFSLRPGDGKRSIVVPAFVPQISLQFSQDPIRPVRAVHFIPGCLEQEIPQQRPKECAGVEQDRKNSRRPDDTGKE